MTRALALSPANLYHVGIVVPDIANAAAHLTDAAGYRWTKTVETDLSITSRAGGNVSVSVATAYSVQVPHLELIRAVPGTVWTPSPNGAIHHLGYWVEDLAASARHLEVAGFDLEVRPSGDTLTSFAYYTNDSGLRIEIVDRALFPDWPGFIESMSD